MYVWILDEKPINNVLPYYQGCSVENVTAAIGRINIAATTELQYSVRGRVEFTRQYDSECIFSGPRSATILFSVDIMDQIVCIASCFNT